MDGGMVKSLIEKARSNVTNQPKKVFVIENSRGERMTYDGRSCKPVRWSSRKGVRGHVYETRAKAQRWINKRHNCFDQNGDMLSDGLKILEVVK